MPAISHTEPTACICVAKPAGSATRKCCSRDNKRMTYDDVLARLATMGPELRTGKAGAPRKWSLDHIATLLRALGDPHRTFRSVLIAGTNGKGSTAATLASILNAAGLRTGLY